jgi:hypothetical protein
MTFWRKLCALRSEIFWPLFTAPWGDSSTPYADLPGPVNSFRNCDAEAFFLLTGRCAGNDARHDCRLP